MWVKVGSEFQVNSEQQQFLHRPDVTALNDGAFAFTWAAGSGTPWITGEQSQLGIRAKFFDGSGGLFRDEFVVDPTGWTFPDPEITTLANGRVVITWEDGRGNLQPRHPGTSEGVKAKIFDASGALVRDEFILDVPASDPTITALGSGGFAVSWNDSTGLVAKVFDENGEMVREEFIVASGGVQSAITALSDGGFVITFQRGASDTSRTVHAKIFDVSGALLRDEFLVSPANGHHILPDVAALSNGGFVAAWTSVVGEPDPAARRQDIIARVFDSSGDAVTDAFLVNTPLPTNHYRFNAAVAGLPDGGFLVTWQDDPLGNGTRFAQHDVMAKVFDAEGGIVQGEFIVTKTTVGNQITPTVTALSTGQFVIGWEHGGEGGPAIKAQVYGPYSLNSTEQRDFDSDGRTAVLWHNDDGRVHVWEMDGTAIKSEAAHRTVDPGWRIQDTGDFDGDSSADILWRHDDGRTYLWLMHGDRIKAENFVRPVETSWRVEGTGDFDGDGRSDVLWRNADGLVHIWEMDGIWRQDAFRVPAEKTVRPVEASWHVQGIADFDGDDKADVLWRNDDGRTYIWTMDGFSVKSEGGIRPVERSWHVEGTGDFDGDGKADILWRNDDGRNYLWQMDGIALKSEGHLRPVETSWEVEQVFDFDADGRSDILWRNDDGRVYVWEMNGLSMTGEGAVRPVDASWHVTDHHFDLI